MLNFSWVTTYGLSESVFSRLNFYVWGLLDCADSVVGMLDYDELWEIDVFV